MLSLLYHTLCDYAKATPSSRNMVDGQCVINSRMLVMCGATEKPDTKIESFSLCLQTAALTSDPHSITGTLLIEEDSNNNNYIHEDEIPKFFNIERMDCSCKAGTSQSCKHIVAVLLYCNRYVISDNCIYFLSLE